MSAYSSNMSRCRAICSVLVVCGVLILVPVEAAAQQCGPLDFPERAYPHTTLPGRTVTGGFAIPAGVVNWNGTDWGAFAAFGTATVVPMLPMGPSLDVRFQDWVQDHRWDGGERFFLHIKSVPVVAGLVGYTTLMAGIGWAFDRPDIMEYTSLMVEAVAITQFWHVVTKLMLGREGPYQGNGRGEFHGPRQVFVPGGTPSGHVATIYAALGTAAEYYDSMPLRILTHVVGIYVGASLIYHNQHFISDVIWGSAMGYYVARWVVRHHSSRYRCGEPVEPYVTWMPTSLDGYGFGLSVMGTF